MKTITRYGLLLITLLTFSSIPVTAHEAAPLERLDEATEIATEYTLLAALAVFSTGGISTSRLQDIFLALMMMKISCDGTRRVLTSIARRLYPVNREKQSKFASVMFSGGLFMALIKAIATSADDNAMTYSFASSIPLYSLIVMPLCTMVVGTIIALRDENLRDKILTAIDVT